MEKQQVKGGIENQFNTENLVMVDPRNKGRGYHPQPVVFYGSKGCRFYFNRVMAHRLGILEWGYCVVGFDPKSGVFLLKKAPGEEYGVTKVTTGKSGKVGSEERARSEMSCRVCIASLAKKLPFVLAAEWDAELSGDGEHIYLQAKKT
jgi:hypothetical protein